jgi:hypothetical protein
MEKTRRGPPRGIYAAKQGIRRMPCPRLCPSMFKKYGQALLRYCAEHLYSKTMF